MPLVKDLSSISVGSEVVDKIYLDELLKYSADLSARQAILATAVCWLQMDEASGTVAANDGVGGSAGTIVNGFTSAAGLLADSLRSMAFDGSAVTQQHITVPDSFTLTDWTISFVIKPANTTNQGYISDFSGVSSIAPILNFTAGKYNIVSTEYPTGTAADTNMTASGAGIPDHVAWKKSGSTLKGFLNGIETVSVTLNTPSYWEITAETLKVAGAFTANANDYTEATIDEFAIHTSALSDANIVTLAAELQGMPPTPDVAYYKTQYDANYALYSSTFDGYSTSGNANTYYTFQFALEGTISLYEATGDTTYILRALAWCEAMVSQAYTINKVDDDGKLNWNGGLDAYGQTDIGLFLDEIQGAAGIALCARVILEDASLGTTYDARAEALYDFVRDHIIYKHLVDRGEYSWLNNKTANTAVVWTDKAAIAASIMCRLQRCNTVLGVSDSVNGANTFGTGQNYTTFLADKATKFKSRLLEADDGDASCTCFGGGASVGTLVYDCDSLESRLPNHSDDTSHANRAPAMCIDLYESGYTSGTQIELTDLEGLAKLINEVIWNGSTTSPLFTNFTDGNNDPWSTNLAYESGVIYHGWVKLAPYDATTFVVMDSTLRAIVAGTSNASLNKMNNQHGWAALSGHIAKALTEA